MAASFDIDLLRAFVTVADMGSFTRAARRLGLTQSATSLQIRRLEDQVGATLLHRHPRGVQPTASGEAFMVYARKLLELQEEALRSVRVPGEDGAIRFGLPDVYAMRYLPAVLDRFAERYPYVMPQIYCSVSTEVVERFEQGELDACLTVKHDAEPVGEILGDETIVWVASPELELSPDGPVPLAVYPEYCVFRAHGLRALADAGRGWRIVYTTQSSAAIDIAITRGWAVAIRARRTCEPGWRELGEAEAMPELEPVQLELRRSPTDESKAFRHFCEVLEDAVRADLAAG